MNTFLLEQLDNSDLLKGKKPSVSSLQSFSKKELLDFLHQAIELTSASGIAREHSIYSQSASLSLAGGREPCESLECRLKNVRDLAQYAALYADKVYAYNPLAYQLARHDEPDEDELKVCVYEDLFILGYLRPLIEAGRIIIITPPKEFCPRCFSYKFASKDFRDRADSLYRSMSEKYLNETKVEFEKIGPTYAYITSGPEYLIEHGITARVVEELPDDLIKKPRIMGRIERGETISLSRTVLKSIIQLHKSFAADVLQNVFFELACAQCFGTSFLTERPLHIEALNYLSGDYSLTSRNQLIQKHLTTLVPFVSSVRVEDLLKLRKKEGEAFILFRQALTKALEEYRSCLDSAFGPKDACQLYGDVIEPGLTKLDLKIKSTTKKLLKGTAARVAAWAGAISFGLYSGLIPTDLVKAATALGLTKVLVELGAPLIKSQFKKDNLTNMDMYFLWRVREISRKQ